METITQILEGTDLAPANDSLSATLLALTLAFVLGQSLAWVYVRTHSGLSYSRSFTQSLVIMTIVVTLLMFVIGHNIIYAFGLLGALAMVRFRNVLKDTRDAVFIFMALVVGMAVGTQRFGMAILGTLVLYLVVFYLSYTSFGTIGRFDGYLTMQLTAPSVSTSLFGDILNKFCRATKQISTRHAGAGYGAEIVYQIGLRDRSRGHELVEQLRGVEGVTQASLVVRDELSEV